MKYLGWFLRRLPISFKISLFVLILIILIVIILMIMQPLSLKKWFNVSWPLVLLLLQFASWKSWVNILHCFCCFHLLQVDVVSYCHMVRLTLEGLVFFLSWSNHRLFLLFLGFNRRFAQNLCWNRDVFEHVSTYRVDIRVCTFDMLVNCIMVTEIGF